MKRYSFITIVFFALIMGLPLFAQEQPNILWLTCEDMSDFYVSCYGGTTIETPNIDALAAKGIKYNQAYSCGAQCSPARTTLVTGCYAPSLGGEWHRADRALPRENYWTPYLTLAGYYCASKGKMNDYNANNTHPNELWHEGKTYTSAPANTPWFSIINFYPTHMSSVTNYNIGQRTNRTIDPSDVVVPAYVPDIDSIRDDLAWHLEFVKDLDVWVGQQLQALEDAGIAENTIIFFFSDHGGSLPNSKGYLNNGGTKVPFIVYFPEKWKHLAGVTQPSEKNNRVGFVDFGPTVLSIAGIDPPGVFQGKAFLGQYAEPSNDLVYLYKANQGINYIPSRAITNERIKFIWNYNTAFPAGSRQDFQWKMPGYRGWELAFRNHTIAEPYNLFWEPQPAFELYDLTTDPHEGSNLAANRQWADTLEKYKQLLQQRVRESNDLGFFPESMRDYNSTTNIFYNWVHDNNYNLELSIAAAEFASTATSTDTDSLLSLLQHPEQVVRYWGSLGFFQLARRGLISETPEYLATLMNNEFENIEIRLNCAAALIYTDEYCGSLELILSEYMAKTREGHSYMHSIEDKAQPVAHEMYNYVNSGNNGFYERSGLINTGVIPYTTLLPSESIATYDTTVFMADSLTQQCMKKKSCGTIILEDNFDDNILPDGWSELYTNGQVIAVNQQLEIDFNTGHPAAVRSLHPTAGNLTVTFDFMSERNWFTLPFNVLSEKNDTIATIVFGNNADKGIFLKTHEGNVNLIDETFTKNSFYTVSLTLNTYSQTVSATVNGITFEQAIGQPFLSAADSIASLVFHFTSMYDNSKKSIIDNVSISENINKDELILAITEAWQLLSETLTGETPGCYPAQQWEQLNASFYLNYDILQQCGLPQSAYEDAASDLQLSTQAYLDSQLPPASALPAQSHHHQQSPAFPSIFQPQTQGYLYPTNTYHFTHYQCSIYSVMGQKVYTSSQSNQLWDGQYNGNPCPNGIYIYTLRAIHNQDEILQTGKIILINN